MQGQFSIGNTCFQKYIQCVLNRFKEKVKRPSEYIQKKGHKKIQVDTKFNGEILYPFLVKTRNKVKMLTFNANSTEKSWPML